MFHKVISFAALLLAAPPALAQFTDFEDLTLNTTYPVGSMFTSNGLSFEVVQFGNFGSPASVGNFGYAGGSGNEIWMPNTVGLEFQLASQVQRVSMRFGTFCCDSGIVVNGVASPKSGNWNGLNGMTFGGVLVSAFETNSRGVLELNGPINSLIVGGTEIAVDDVLVVPEPGFIALALAAILPIGFWRRGARLGA